MLTVEAEQIEGHHAGGTYDCSGEYTQWITLHCPTRGAAHHRGETAARPAPHHAVQCRPERASHAHEVSLIYERAAKMRRLVADLQRNLHELRGTLHALRAERAPRASLNP